MHDDDNHTDAFLFSSLKKKKKKGQWRYALDESVPADNLTIFSSFRVDSFGSFLLNLVIVQSRGVFSWRDFFFVFIFSWRTVPFFLSSSKSNRKTG